MGNHIHLLIKEGKEPIEQIIKRIGWDTRYCLPPVTITAYMVKHLLMILAKRLGGVFAHLKTPLERLTGIEYYKNCSVSSVSSVFYAFFHAYSMGISAACAMAYTWALKAFEKPLTS